MIKQALLIWEKDVRLEWHTRARVNALLFFSLATLLMFSFATDISVQRKHSGGFYWLAVLFASVLALSESFRVERDNRALEHLLLVPIDARAVFLGKAVSNLSMLLLLGLILIPLSVALFDLQVGWSQLARFAGVLFLGAAAISATGTLLAAISVNARAQDVLLPLLLFPLLIPVLLCSVKASQLALNGDPMGDMSTWTGLLAAFNVTYWSLGFVLFPSVVEE